MPSRPDVAIVGAGAAGIAAARALADAGLSVLLVEASERIGGRAWTQTLDGLALDMGCGWLHSGERNPWTHLAEADGFTVDRTTTAWGEQYHDLGFPLEDQRAAHAAWEDFQQRLRDDPPSSDRAADALCPGGRWNAYAEALSGYINGAGLRDLSITDYLAYDEAASDVNWRVREGYGALVAAHLPPVALKLATPVTVIEHDGAGVRLETRTGTIEAGAAIVTVSTAVLASGAIRFRPAIDGHVEAAGRLPLGLADKLFLGLSGEHGLDAEGHLLGNPHHAGTGSYYVRPLGRPLIEGFFGGEGAQHLEREGLAGAFAFASDELAALLGSDIRKRVRPLAASSWGRAGGFGGSYSHALPGYAGSRATLAAPAGPRLFFAGEATHATDFSTAHGAFHSGMRAAGEALEAVQA